MNLYAVWVSSHLTESGSPKTATWNIPITDTGNYQLDVQADNQAVISFDGVNQGTVNSFTTTTSYSLNNITAGGHTLQAVVTNNVETVDNWSNNPGVAWTLTKLNTPSNITAKFKNNGDLQVQGSGTGTIQLNFSWDETPEYTSANVSVAFDSNGNLVATGTGSATVQLDFEWNDNPNTYGQALGTVAYSSLSASFTQTLGARRGNSSQSVTVTAGNTYNVSISNNPFGFTLKDNGEDFVSMMEMVKIVMLHCSLALLHRHKLKLQQTMQLNLIRSQGIHLPLDHQILDQTLQQSM